jgi:hypothetical protein
MKKTELTGQKSKRFKLFCNPIPAQAIYTKRYKVRKEFCGYLLIILAVFSACVSKEKKTNDDVAKQVSVPTLPEFNSDSAFKFVKEQCDFGPRVPNTKGHVACGDYLIKKMKEWSDTVFVQAGTVQAYDGTNLRFRNIIASFNSQAKNRILLFAHWDTRPWADQDSVDSDKPIIGADDGASGVAVLMEIARVLNNCRINKFCDSTKTKFCDSTIGIDLAFFDAEDYGKSGGGPESEDSYALGTQYWAKKPHVANYTADFGILLDMVGAGNARFLKEGLSKQQAGFVVDNVWTTANNLGYSSYFIYQDGGWITDDHVYVNKINIPSIDIINMQPGSSTGFAPHWHTHRDNLDIIDPNTLKAVGQTLIGIIFQQEAI